MRRSGGSSSRGVNTANSPPSRSSNRREDAVIMDPTVSPSRVHYLDVMSSATCYHSHPREMKAERNPVDPSKFIVVFLFINVDTTSRVASNTYSCGTRACCSLLSSSLATCFSNRISSCCGLRRARDSRVVSRIVVVTTSIELSGAARPDGLVQ